MPVYELLENMPYDEFIKWTRYLESRPIEWRDDFRTAQIMRSFGDKRMPYDIFPTLNFLKDQKSGIKDSLKGSALFQKMLSAKNGDKLSVLENI